MMKPTFGIKFVPGLQPLIVLCDHTSGVARGWYGAGPLALTYGMADLILTLANPTAKGG